MRSFIVLLALPFMAAAQTNTTSEDPFITCSLRCSNTVNPDAMTQCGQDPACLCAFDNGQFITDVGACMQQNCADVVQANQDLFNNFCTSSPTATETAPVETMPTVVSGNGTTTTKPTAVPTSKGGNKTEPTTTGSEGPSDTSTPTDDSGKKPTNTSKTATSTPSGGGAGALEIALQWPVAIIIGLAGAAML